MRAIPDWNSYFMTLVMPIASRSKDPHTQVGAIIVGPDNNIRATGFNSFPRGIRDDVPERLERPEKYMWIEHAERNAIYSAAKCGVPLDGSRIYIRILPCMDCGRAIIQTGITEVVIDIHEQEQYVQTSPKYIPDFERVIGLLKEAGVTVSMWVKPTNP
jgi:dCMP deaminase